MQRVSPWGERDNFVRSKAERAWEVLATATNNQNQDFRNQCAEAHNRDTLFELGSSKEVVSPRRALSLALLSLYDLAAHGRAALFGSPAPRAWSAWRLKISP